MRPVAIVNDLLGGWMGERTFWNYMLEGIPGIRGFDHVTMNCPISEVSAEARKRIQEMPPNTIVIQNATFLGKVSDHNYTIAFLQDNLRAMSRPNVTQENVLQTSHVVVTNSRETAQYYPEFYPETIPIGVDTNIFCLANNKIELREKYGVPTDRLVGIFVGDFTEVKGWYEIRKLIYSKPDIFFILVSKRSENYDNHNAKSFNRVSQRFLADLYNCADFFILGSPVETQCLAALEAAFCGLPLVMRPTGIFTSFKFDQRKMIGVFRDNLSDALQEFLKDPKRFSPRETLMSMDFGIDSMIAKWKTLLESL